MMLKRTAAGRIWFSGAGYLALLMLLLGGVAGLALLKNLRIDLTEDKLYTLSEGSRHIVSGLKEPITLTFYYSEDLAKDIPVLRNYSRRVQDLLSEYVRLSDGKIQLQVIKPDLYSEQEDDAAAAGLQGLPNGEGQNIYFGLSGDHGQQHEVISFFNPQREETLEYEISQLVYRVSRSKPVTVSVIANLPVFRSMDFRTNQVRPPWVIMDQLKEMFEIRQVIDADKVDAIEPDVDLVMLVHPRMLPERTLYAIDQFVLRGGKLLVFVDPDAELDDSEAMMGGGFTDRSSTLDKLFEAWGIAFDPKKVVLDMGYAHSIPVQQYGREVPHLGILGLHDEAINRQQNVIAELDNINIGSVGALSPLPGASTQFTPLLLSSRESQLMDADAYTLVGNHEDLLSKFQPDGQQRVFAAWVSGNVKSAFPQGAPASGEAKSPSAPPAAHLSESSAPIQVIVMADTDVLADRMWADVQDFYGQRIPRAFAANADMVSNMIESLCGSADLVSLRSRGTYQRPFTRVDELERAANERLRSEQDALMQSLADTEKKINELSEQKPAAGENPATGLPGELTLEQQAALTSFQKEKQKIRRNLREVQRQLNLDVEQLGWQLKVINIAAVPVLLTIVALLVSILRVRRARRVARI